MPRRAARPLPWIAAGAFGLLFALATKTTADPDLYGHLRFGLDMLASRSLSLRDSYSFTQDRLWINHEWLSELAMGAAYRAGGIAGLALLKGALLFAAVWLIWRSLAGTEFAARMLIMGAAYLGVGSVSGTLRPQLWSLVLLPLVCAILDSDRPAARRWLPPIFALWANVHGGWIVGLGVAAMWAAIDALIDRRRAGGWAAVLALSAAATLMTPYGFALWRFLFETVRLSRDIGEWQPLWTRPVMNWLPVAAACVAAIWAASRPDRHRWHAAGVLLLLAYASVRVSRIGPLFVAAAAVLLGRSIAARWPARRAASPSPAGPRAELTVALALCLGMIAGAGRTAAATLRCIEVPDESWAAPREAAQLLAGAQPGRLVTFFDWGEYALWHLGPALRVSMDGRRETVYSDRRLAEHDAILAGRPDGLRLLDLWRPEYVWLPARSADTKRWLAGHGYRIELDSAASFVAVRADMPRLGPPPATAPSRRCFPE